jgi:hypothetical protein
MPWCGGKEQPNMQFKLSRYNTGGGGGGHDVIQPVWVTRLHAEFDKSGFDSWQGQWIFSSMLSLESALLPVHIHRDKAIGRCETVTYTIWCRGSELWIAPTSSWRVAFSNW